MCQLSLQLALLGLQALDCGLCVSQRLSGGGQVHLEVVVLSGDHLHLLVLCLKV